MTQPERTLASAVMRHGTTLLSRRNVTDELIPASRHRCRRRVEQSSCGPFGLLHWLKHSLGSDGQPAEHRSSRKFTRFNVPCLGRKVMQMFQKGRFPLLKTFSIDFGSFSPLKKTQMHNKTVFAKPSLWSRSLVLSPQNTKMGKCFFQGKTTQKRGNYNSCHLTVTPPQKPPSEGWVEWDMMPAAPLPLPKVWAPHPIPDGLDHLLGTVSKCRGATIQFKHYRNAALGEVSREPDAKGHPCFSGEELLIFYLFASNFFFFFILCVRGGKHLIEFRFFS